GHTMNLLINWICPGKNALPIHWLAFQSLLSIRNKTIPDGHESIDLPVYIH
ncbi:hypothetical protein L9F63_002814, partial [Diploptera punctata]